MSVFRLNDNGCSSPLDRPMTLKKAREVTGHRSGLGRPSKMPGWSTAIPASACKVGAKLAKIEGSVCSGCYALKGNYQFPDVKSGHRRRLEALVNPLWIDGMVKLVGHYTDPEDPYFRVHDAGDLQSKRHLLMWIAVARALPWVRFWVPSKETRMVKAVKAMLGSSWPENLVIRLSAPMKGQKPPKSMEGHLTSTVEAGTGFECKAWTRGNSCGPCRACWDPTIQNIDYHKQ